MESPAVIGIFNDEVLEQNKGSGEYSLVSEKK